MAKWDTVALVALELITSARAWCIGRLQHCQLKIPGYPSAEINLVIINEYNLTLV